MKTQEMMDKHWAYNSRCVLTLCCPFFLLFLTLTYQYAKQATLLSSRMMYYLRRLYKLLLWNAASEGGLKHSSTEDRAIKFIAELLC